MLSLLLITIVSAQKIVSLNCTNVTISYKYETNAMVNANIQSLNIIEYNNTNYYFFDNAMFITINNQLQNSYSVYANSIHIYTLFCNNLTVCNPLFDETTNVSAYFSSVLNKQIIGIQSQLCPSKPNLIILAIILPFIVVACILFYYSLPQLKRQFDRTRSLN